jgi:hypothetical protein
VDVEGGTAGLVRRDGLAWQDDGFQVGQLISIVGSATTWTITGFGDAPCTDPDPFASCGLGSRMLLAGASLTDQTDVTRRISVVDAAKITAAGSMTLGASSVTRAGGDWTADGF